MQEVCQKQWRDGRSLHRQDKIGGEKMSIFQQLNLVFSLFVVATPDAMIDILFRISCISCSDSPCKSYLFLVLSIYLLLELLQRLLKEFKRFLRLLKGPKGIQIATKTRQVATQAHGACLDGSREKTN